MVGVCSLLGLEPVAIIERLHGLSLRNCSELGGFTGDPTARYRRTRYGGGTIYRVRPLKSEQLHRYGSVDTTPALVVISS